jgi:4-carboxymuconolactone decarboxylase
MITIALLTALAKPEQLRVYVGVGMNLGLSRAQICEIIWHTAIYAGFPAAVEGFRIAGEAFAEYDAAAAGDGEG